MRNILKKAKELGNEVVDSVKETAEEVSEKVKDLRKEDGFLVETFTTPMDMEERLNDLLDIMKEVDVQSICTHENYLVVVIKVS